MARSDSKCLLTNCAIPYKMHNSVKANNFKTYILNIKSQSQNHVKTPCQKDIQLIIFQTFSGA